MNIKSSGIQCVFLFSFMLFAAAEAISDTRSEMLMRYNRDFSAPPFIGDATNYTATIDPNTTYGEWEGWGSSLCWWGAAFGDRDDLADLFFTLQTTTTLEGSTLPGLGLTIARYNAGGSSYIPDSSGEEMVVSKDIIPSRQMFGFWQDWDSPDPTSSSWNWTADALQVSMLQKVQARGAVHLELFSNSPMWWMCVNHNPSGNDDGSKDNLESWNYEQHAVYLATIAARFKEGPFLVNFTSVEAFNEPVSDWWSSNGTQEGCHFDPTAQAATIPLLRAQLDARGLSAVSVASSDENTYDHSLSTWESFNQGTQGLVGKVNTHGYQQAEGRRDLLYAAVVGKAKLWNSEYGDGDPTGLSLAANLNLDFKWLHNTAWVYWQVLDGNGWGLLSADEDDDAAAQGGPTVGAANSKFFVLAHYTRHIRPGMTVMSTSGDDTVAAYDSASQTVAVVSVVFDKARWVTIDLSGFSKEGGGALEGLPVSRWVTNTGVGSVGGDQYKAYNDVAVGADGSISVYFEANTLMTFEVTGVIVRS